MNKEEYLILKKEAKIRLLFIILLVILGAVLSLVMIANHSPYHSFMSIFIITMFGLNFGFLFPCWQRRIIAILIHYICTVCGFVALS